LHNFELLKHLVGWIPNEELPNQCIMRRSILLHFASNQSRNACVTFYGFLKFIENFLISQCTKSVSHPYPAEKIFWNSNRVDLIFKTLLTNDHFTREFFYVFHRQAGWVNCGLFTKLEGRVNLAYLFRIKIKLKLKWKCH
jgi:hypothetical protein